MHDCQFCGCACYCGGDIDDVPVGDHCRVGCGCEDDGSDQNEQAWEDLRADGGLPEAQERIYYCEYRHCAGHPQPNESCVP